MSVKPACPHPTRRSIIAAAGLVLGAGWGKWAAAQEDAMALPDAADGMNVVMPQKPPALVFSDVRGQRRTLADYAGHVLLVNLWATWCGPCVEELPSFAALAPKIRPSGALVLPVSIDLGGAPTVRSFYAAHGIRDLPILLDPNGANMQALGTQGIPVTVIINAAGKLVARLDGAANWNTRQVVAYLGTLGAAPDKVEGGVVPV